MNYFSESFDEVTSESNYDEKEEIQRSDNRPLVSLRRKGPEKPKRKIGIGRKRLYESSTSTSKPYESSTSISNLNSGVSKGVSKLAGPSTASANPHRGPKRFINVVNGDSDQDGWAAVLAKSAAIMNNIGKGKRLQSPSINKKNHLSVPKLANPVPVGEKPLEAGGLTPTPSHALLASLDDFSPSPVGRRNSTEGVGNYSSDGLHVVEKNVHALESNDQELHLLPPPISGAPLARTSTNAEVNVAPSHDTPKGNTVSAVTNKAGKATTAIKDQLKNPVSTDLQKNKTPDVADDSSIKESKEKHGVKRNQLKEKLEAHDKEEEEQGDDPNVSSEDKEPAPTKASLEITANNKLIRSSVTRESDKEDWFGAPPPRAATPPGGSVRKILAREKEEGLDSLGAGVNSNPKSSSIFKKPFLPHPKKTDGPAKCKDVNPPQEVLSGGKHKPEEATEAKVKEVMPSDKAKVPQEEFMENRYLTMWVPLLRNKKLYIDGYLMNFDSGLSSRWSTSRIVSRISDRRVATKKTCYVLEGQLAIPATGERPMPLFVIDKFKDGFPENWQNVIQHWIYFNDQSLADEARNQTILTNIQSLTMTMFNSTPMPGMMSNINISNMSSIANTSRALSRTPVKKVLKVNEMAGVDASKGRSPPKQVAQTDEASSDQNQPTGPIESIVENPPASSDPTCETLKSAKTSIDKPAMANPVTVSTKANVTNTSSAKKNTPETPAVERSTNLTMSIHDFSCLEFAKNYQHTKIVERKKFYLCQFCDYECKTFAIVKEHLKHHHVDEDHNEPNVLPKDPSPSTPKIKPQSKISNKRKSKNKVHAVQGQQEMSPKKSRFGRQIIKPIVRSSLGKCYFMIWRATLGSQASRNHANK